MNCPRCGNRIRMATFDGRCTQCGKSDYLQPYAIQALQTEVKQ